MTTLLIVLVALLVIGAGIVFWGISIYNSLVHYWTLVQEAWSGVDVQLKRRSDLIPNVVATVKQYSIHEKGTLEEVARLRSQATQARTLEDKISAEQQLTGAIRNLMVVVEQYPNLKANENFMNLQNQLSAIENEIQLARRYYNGTVRNYNVQVIQFPSSLVARTTGFTQAPFFTIANDSDRDVPKVQF